MSGTFLLARRYIAYYRGRTSILVACLALTMYLPVAARLVIKQFQQRAISRARSTPLVIGAKGSRFGLTLHALHFRGDTPEAISMADVDRVREDELAEAIPLYVRFKARGSAIVGTTPDYHALRETALDKGDPLQRLGDCLLGATVAERLILGPGDRLSSESENVFDPAGPSPLSMRVVGVLKRTGTADDDVIFTDLKTTWIMQGLGHGHDFAEERESDSSDSDHTHKASRANLPQHTEVTDANVHTFHFHGSPDDFPLTAIIAVPNDERSETLLLGRYLSPAATAQILQPTAVVHELMDIVLRVRRFFDSATLLFAIAAVLLVTLVTLLSLRLRQREMGTMFKLGCSRWTMLRIQFAELAIVILLSIAVVGLLAWGTVRAAPRLIDLWLV